MIGVLLSLTLTCALYFAGMVGSSSKHTNVLPLSRLDKGKGVMVESNALVRHPLGLTLGRGVLTPPEKARGPVNDTSPEESSEGNVNLK